jgi:hypothetical protein
MDQRRFLSKSGGLVWHWRALTRRHRWQHFIQPLDQWLRAWPQQSDALLLIGASAGWCLESGFLQRYRHIHAIDPEPLAQVLFRLRHGKALRESASELHWRQQDAIADLRQLLQRHQGQDVLFSNMLGQHGFHRPSTDQAESEISELKQELMNFNWASYHDRLSGRQRLNDDTLRSRTLPAGLDAVALARRLGLQGEWADHLTSQVLPVKQDRLYLPWQLTAERLHWVEVGHG